MTLQTILLDGAQGLIVVPIYFIFHLLITLLIEGVILFKMLGGSKKNRFMQALIVNLASLVIGMFLYIAIEGWSVYFSELSGQAIYPIVFMNIFFFFETLLVEGIFLKLLNKQVKTKVLLSPLIIMNSITYIILASILSLTFNML